MQYAIVKNLSTGLYHFFEAKIEQNTGKIYAEGKSLCSKFKIQKTYVDKTYSNVTMRASVNTFFSESTEDVQIINKVNKFEDLPKNFCRECGPIIEN